MNGISKERLVVRKEGVWEKDDKDDMSRNKSRMIWCRGKGSSGK